MGYQLNISFVKMFKFLIFSNVLFTVVFLMMESEAIRPPIDRSGCFNCEKLRIECLNMCRIQEVKEKDADACLRKCPGIESEACKSCKKCKKSKECKSCRTCKDDAYPYLGNCSSICQICFSRNCFV